MYLMPGNNQHSRKKQFMFIWASLTAFTLASWDISLKTGWEPMRCELWHGLTLYMMLGSRIQFEKNSFKTWRCLLQCSYLNIYNHIYIYLFIYIVLTYMYIYIYMWLPPPLPTKIHQQKHGVTSTQNLLMLNLRVFKKPEAKKECHVIFISKAPKIWKKNLGSAQMPMNPWQSHRIHVWCGLFDYKTGWFRVFSCKQINHTFECLGNWFWEVDLLIDWDNRDPWNSCVGQ